MESVIADLCAGTAADWDVRVVSSNDARQTLRERIEGVDVVRAGSFGVKHSVPLCPAYPLHVWRRSADCVVLHEPNPIAGTSLFLRTPAPRLIVWHHSDLLRPSWAPATYGRVQRALYRRADCVIVSSPNLAAHSPLVSCARRIAVVPFGIGLERFQRRDPSSASYAAALRTSATGPLFLFVGRLVYYKGLEVLIDAMASLRRHASSGRRRAPRRRAARSGRSERGSRSRQISWPRSPRDVASALPRGRYLRLALRRLHRNVWGGSGRGDGGRPAGHQHEFADRRPLGEPARRQRARCGTR